MEDWSDSCFLPLLLFSFASPLFLVFSAWFLPARPLFCVCFVILWPSVFFLVFSVLSLFLRLCFLSSFLSALSQSFFGLPRFFSGLFFWVTLLFAFCHLRFRDEGTKTIGGADARLCVAPLCVCFSPSVSPGPLCFLEFPLFFFLSPSSICPFPWLLFVF